MCYYQDRSGTPAKKKGGETVASGEKQYKADLGNRIIELRKARGLNQKELAEKLGISPTRLNYWEKGKSAPSIAFIDKIADVLSVPVSTLLGWDEENGFIDYLSSLGYSVNQAVTKWHEEVQDQGTAPIPDVITVEITSLSSGKKYHFSLEKFDSFRLNIKKAVEFFLYQSENE